MSDDEDLEMEEESEEETMGFQADSDQDTDEEVRLNYLKECMIFLSQSFRCMNRYYYLIH